MKRQIKDKKTNIQDKKINAR